DFVLQPQRINGALGGGDIRLISMQEFAAARAHTVVGRDGQQIRGAVVIPIGILFVATQLSLYARRPAMREPGSGKGTAPPAHYTEVAFPNAVAAPIRPIRIDVPVYATPRERPERNVAASIRATLRLLLSL